MTDIDYAARVARGIALMDEKWPAWATEVDLETLDIFSVTRCMTAQYARVNTELLGADYRDGQNALDLTDDEYEEHGFNVDGASDEDADTDMDGYAILNDLWRAEILRRRAQADASPAESEATA